MPLMAKVKRLLANGSVVEAAVNPDLVRHVSAKLGGGSYIAFQDEATQEGVDPIGVDSPECVKKVKRRLNRPYWIDIGVRVGGLILSTAFIFLAILRLLSSSKGTP